MRTFYIFKINEDISSLYGKNSNRLYKLYNRIRNSNKIDYIVAKNVYKKITSSINKKLLDNYIVMSHVNDLYYKKNTNEHVLISDGEKSTLFIYNSFIKINTSNNVSSFFKDLYDLNSNLFCIDFENEDYFFLEDFKVKLLV